jgi:hypothetical protein
MSDVWALTGRTLRRVPLHTGARSFSGASSYRPSSFAVPGSFQTSMFFSRIPRTRFFWASLQPVADQFGQ